MDLKLTGKVALISGGAAGIGRATARLLAGEGVRLLLADKNSEAGTALAADLTAAGSEVSFLAGDLTLERVCQQAVRQALDQFGQIDILVNNAGVNDSIALAHSPADFMASLQRNLFHVFALGHYACEALKASQGSIVNISSKVSVTGQGRTSGYAAAKGGVNALTREWAAALAPFGVRVNCVVPAECDTDQYQKWFASQADPARARGSIEKLVPLGKRLTRPEEIAAMIVFLTSPISSHTTGEVIFVDGGYTHLDRALDSHHPKWGES